MVSVAVSLKKNVGSPLHFYSRAIYLMLSPAATLVAFVSRAFHSTRYSAVGAYQSANPSILSNQ